MPKLITVKIFINCTMKSVTEKSQFTQARFPHTHGHNPRCRVCVFSGINVPFSKYNGTKKMFLTAFGGFYYY